VRVWLECGAAQASRLCSSTYAYVRGFIDLVAVEEGIVSLTRAVKGC
jgi:hypothetical protein